MKCKICGKEIGEHDARWGSVFGEGFCCSKECFTKDYWNCIVEEKDQHVIYHHECFYIDDDRVPMGFKGMDGRHYAVELTNGKTINTTNLWVQGRIPEEYWDRLPDNAVSIKEIVNHD